MGLVNDNAGALTRLATVIVSEQTFSVDLVTDNAGGLTRLATVIFSEQTVVCGFSQLSDGSQMLGIVECANNDTLVVR